MIQNLNRRFEERFGYDSAAIAGESLVDLVVGDGNQIEGYVVCTDITERKQA